MTIKFIDIETVPTSNQKIIDAIKESITAPGNYKNPDAIKKWMDENLESEVEHKLRKTALDGAYGEIASIAWAYDDEPVNVVYRDEFKSESELLTEYYWQAISTLPLDKHSQYPLDITKWVGHYITGFDLRFLWQRSVINEIKPKFIIPVNAKPWDKEVFDTKLAWSGTSSQYQGASKLGDLCEAMGFAGKGDLDGSKVFDAWLAGEFTKIAEYNKDDVVKTRQLYKRMNFIKDSEI